MSDGKLLLITFHLSPITHFMRLDLFLKASRLSPRRSAAQALCDAGVVSINGAPAKSAHTVRAGDMIEIRRRDRRLTVRVTSLPATRQTSSSDAPNLYEILSDTVVSEDR
jgi:ribosomal 50S subunit-recycling heat shock protein